MQLLWRSKKSNQWAATPTLIRSTGKLWVERQRKLHLSSNLISCLPDLLTIGGFSDFALKGGEGCRKFRGKQQGSRGTVAGGDRVEVRGQSFPGHFEIFCLILISKSLFLVLFSYWILVSNVLLSNEHLNLGGGGCNCKVVQVGWKYFPRGGQNIFGGANSPAPTPQKIRLC
jgi:hypothetical protein